MLAPESVYSGDIGVKFVQARALADHRFMSLDIPYPGEFLDPAREFIPLRPPFVLITGGTTQAIFPPASAVLQAVAVAAAGFRGLIVLSIVAAAVVLVASSMLAPPRYEVAAVIAVGLGGPLWFYAVSGWYTRRQSLSEQPRLRGCLIPASLALAPWIAGALVGTGASLRDEVLLLAPGLLLSIWFRQRGWWRVGAAVGGLLMPLAIAAALEVWWFERPAAAHLRHAVHLVQAALHVTEEPNPELPVLRPMTLRERYDTVVTYWTFGRGTDAQVAGFVTALLPRSSSGGSGDPRLVFWFGCSLSVSPRWAICGRSRPSRNGLRGSFAFRRSSSLPFYPSQSARRSESPQSPVRNAASSGVHWSSG